MIYGLLVIFILVHVILVDKLTMQHTSHQTVPDQYELFVLPSPILRILAFDFKGIVSDFLFMKGLVYLGGFASKNYGSPKKLQLTDAQWRAFYNVMNVSTDLDPYFQDPYYLTNAFLPWDAGMVAETNTLLSKGSQYRDWDWTLPFFCGFNYFYFLQENDKAAEKLMEAARRPGASPIIASLASKLAFKANKTESSILFLEEMISKTNDEQTKKEFATRVDAYKSILALEKAVDVYREKFKKTPDNLDMLIKRKIIVAIPKDPYGGDFYIDSQGAVKTTSESLLIPYRKKQ